MSMIAILLAMQGAALPALSTTFQPGEVEVMNFKTPERKGEADGQAYTYRIEPNGKATYAEIGDWVIHSSVDPMSDARTWYITHDESRLMIFPAVSKPSAEFCVMGHDFPGRSVMVRVDAKPAIAPRGDECFTSPALYADLLAGQSSIRTKRYEWPDDVPEYSEGPASHFAQAVKLLSYMKRASFPRR